MAANGGVTPSSEFDADVLRVDMAAFLTIEDDPGYIANHFSAPWFGSRTAAVNAAKCMFAQLLPGDGATSLWLQGRPPGKIIDSLDPFPALRAAELQDLGEGFADAVDNAKIWTRY